MKRFIGFLMMVLFIGAFTGFGNTTTDLTKNSEKVITVSADDLIIVDVLSLNEVFLLKDVYRPYFEYGEKQFLYKKSKKKIVSYLLKKLIIKPETNCSYI